MWEWNEVNEPWERNNRRESAIIKQVNLSESLFNAVKVKKGITQSPMQFPEEPLTPPEVALVPLRERGFFIKKKKGADGILGSSQWVQ